MAQGGTSFWKVFLGVLAALVLVGGCIIGACVVLIGRAAVGVARSQADQLEYVAKMDTTVDEFTRQDDYAYVRGSVRNGGKRTVRYWKAQVRYLDRSGNVIDTDFANSTDTLRPGESKSFEVMHRYDPRARRADVHVEEVRID